VAACVYRQAGDLGIETLGQVDREPLRLRTGRTVIEPDEITA